MNQYLFSYGTLQEENVQLQIFGRKLNGFNDILQGYKLSQVEIKDESFLKRSDERYHLNVIRSNDSSDSIEGTVFEVSEQELHSADTYEPDYYERIKVVLQSGREAWIYTAK